MSAELVWLASLLNTDSNLLFSMFALDVPSVYVRPLSALSAETPRASHFLLLMNDKSFLGLCLYQEQSYLSVEGLFALDFDLLFQLFIPAPILRVFGPLCSVVLTLFPFSKFLNCIIDPLLIKT